MKKIKWYLYTGFAGHKHEGKIEIDDNATDTEIAKAVKEEAFDYIARMRNLKWGWNNGQ